MTLATPATPTASTTVVTLTDADLTEVGPELRQRQQEHGRQNGEVLRHIVCNRKGGQRAAGDEQLFADLDDFDDSPWKDIWESHGRSPGN